jgi:ubiquitin carboxyl-terminal hydrolase 12/46
MGGSHSTLPKDIDGVDESERFWGLDNFGNTCYINSVLQALFYCKLFRDRLLEYVASVAEEDHDDRNVLFALADLFKHVRAVLGCPWLLTRFLDDVCMTLFDDSSSEARA